MPDTSPALWPQSRDATCDSDSDSNHAMRMALPQLVPLGHKHRVTLGKSRSPFALRADFGEGDGDEAVCH